MRPRDLFQFCPRCGERNPGPPQDAFECKPCGFVYHFNPATAAAAFIYNARGEVLFIRRAHEPARGKLALPGGFVDAGESAEAGARREIREEVNLEVASMRYLCSAPNQYHYLTVTYAVLDLFFVAEAIEASMAAARDGVQSYFWVKPAQVDPSEIAFESIRLALVILLERAGAEVRPEWPRRG